MKKPRKFNSLIHIEKDGKWIFEGNAIEQTDILFYFRQNLRESESPNGIYIENQFGELSENGYIQTIGFPLGIESIAEESNDLVFWGNDGRTFALDELLFFHNEDEEIFCMEKGKKKIKYRISRSALGNLLPFLEEVSKAENPTKNYSHFIGYNGKICPIHLWAGSIGVDVPETFEEELT